MAINLNMDLKTKQIDSADVANVLNAVDASGNGRLAIKQTLAQNQQNHETTMQNADHTHQANMSAADRRARTIRTGMVAGTSALALGVGSLIVGPAITHGIDASREIATAQANADTARAQAEASRINVETGDRNMCNIVVISTDKDGNKTVLNLGEGNPNDPHLTGDAIAELIKDGKATGGNVKVGNTNEATAVITLDATGKIVSTVIPESCKQEAGEVFDSPKA